MRGFVTYPVSSSPSLRGMGLVQTVARSPRAMRGRRVLPAAVLPSLGAPYCYITSSGARECGDTTDAGFMAAAAAAGQMLTPGGGPIVYRPPLSPVPSPIAPVAAPPAGTPESFGIPEGAFVQASDGVPGSFAGDSVYIIQNGQRHWVTDPATFAALGGEAQYIMKIPSAKLNQIPLGESITPVDQYGQTPAAATAQSFTATPPAPSPSQVLTAATPVVNTTAAGTVATTLEAGATYDATTGTYTNPDGSIYYPVAATSTFDITSPSTWSPWVWGALAVGVGAFALLKKR